MSKPFPRSPVSPWGASQLGRKGGTPGPPLVPELIWAAGLAGQQHAQSPGDFPTLPPACCIWPPCLRPWSLISR